jgi:cell division protein FtsB
MQGKTVLGILFAAIVVVEIAIITLMQFQLNDLQKENQEKIDAVESLELRIAELEYELSLSDEEYYKQAAKDAGYYDPNEIIYNTDLAD